MKILKATILSLLFVFTLYFGQPAFAEVNKPPCECETAYYKGVWSPDRNCMYMDCK